MSPPPTEIWLRLESPFFLEAALQAANFEHVIPVEAFADDAIAARVTAALRASLATRVAAP